MSACDLSVVLFAPDADQSHRASQWLASVTARPAETVAAQPCGSPGRARNRALAACAGPYAVFAEPDDLHHSTFFEHACRILDGDKGITFVTAWLDGVPAAGDRPPRPCDLSSVISRPWFLHILTVFRRALWDAMGGYDESLAGTEDADFWLRVWTAGNRGVAVETPSECNGPWGDSLPADGEGALAVANCLFQKHERLFADHHEELLLGRERVTRELHATQAIVDRRLNDKRQELEWLRQTITRARIRGGP